LTGEGKVEAAALADQLASAPVRAVYSSPRRRTRETAAAIANRHGLEVIVALPLDEIDFGAWTGEYFEDLDERPEWRLWNEARASSRPPGGESMAEAVARAAAFIDQASGDGISVFVTHCDVIRGLLCQQDGRSFDAIFDFDVAPGAIVPLRDPPVELAA